MNGQLLAALPSVQHMLQCPTFWGLVIGAPGLWLLLPARLRFGRRIGGPLLAVAGALFAYDLPLLGPWADQGVFWLLAAVTWITSLIPFIGAAAVWIPVCLGLAAYERYTAAIFLAIYGTIVISGTDNLIRAYVIGGESKLHPLVVLISVLGAIEFMGLWGIFAGPMIAALFYSLLAIAQRHMPPPPSGPRKRRRPRSAAPEPRPARFWLRSGYVLRR